MLHSLYVLLLPAILLQSIEALGLKTLLARGHRGILKRYCQTAQSPKCLQSHLVYQSITNLMIGNYPISPYVGRKIKNQKKINKKSNQKIKRKKKQIESSKKNQKIIKAKTKNNQKIIKSWVWLIPAWVFRWVCFWVCFQVLFGEILKIPKTQKTSKGNQKIIKK